MLEHRRTQIVLDSLCTVCHCRMCELGQILALCCQMLTPTMLLLAAMLLMYVMLMVHLCV